ncbi:MFS transporter [Paenibacillus sp. TAB 01]|uniref:MFS transporter n=1 Tax=Paenibacillus sp. TAB 01 TaxID=3368988 RepID=UPI003750B6B8
MKTSTAGSAAEPSQLDRHRTSMEAKKSVRIVAWITAVSLLGDSMLYIVLPVYWQQFGLQSLWQVGFLLSVNRFVRLPLNPLIGWLYGRISKRAGIVLAVGLAVLTTLAYGSLSGFTLLLIARTLWGAAWSLLRIGGYLTVLEASRPTNRGSLLGSYNGIIGIGSLIGMLAGGLLAELIGARYVALVLGVATAAGLPLAWRFLPVSPTGQASAETGEKAGLDAKETGAASAAPKQATMASSRLAGLKSLTAEGWLVLASGLITGVIFFGVYLGTMSPLIEAHMPASGTILLMGAAWGAASVAGIVQAVRWAWSPFLSPRIGAWSDGPRGRLPVYGASLALAAAAFLLLPLQPPFAAWLAILMAAQLANTAIVTLTDALAADTAGGSSRVAYMTTYTTVVDVGAALGPLLGFAALGALGLGTLYAGCALLLMLLGAAWALYAASRKRKRIS